MIEMSSGDQDCAVLRIEIGCDENAKPDSDGDTGSVKFGSELFTIWKLVDESEGPPKPPANAEPYPVLSTVNVAFSRNVAFVRFSKNTVCPTLKLFAAVIVAIPSRITTSVTGADEANTERESCRKSWFIPLKTYAATGIVNSVVNGGLTPSLRVRLNIKLSPLMFTPAVSMMSEDEVLPLGRTTVVPLI